MIQTNCIIGLLSYTPKCNSDKEKDGLYTEVYISGHDLDSVSNIFKDYLKNNKFTDETSISKWCSEIKMCLAPSPKLDYCFTTTIAYISKYGESIFVSEIDK